MPFNPFKEKAGGIMNVDTLQSLYQKPYNKKEVDPFTKVRILLASSMQHQAIMFLHSFHLNCNNNDIRRQLAVIRRVEQQQQKRLASLKPINESLLETTISYEQMSVDLTATLAQIETDRYVKDGLDFALVEDFDHLYRFSDLLEMEQGVNPQQLVGGYTEIMPGRPTISGHRHPYDDVKRYVSLTASTLQTRLNVRLILAAEQQIMYFYNYACGYHTTELGRMLFAEIAMIEEQHITQYGSLMDVNATWLENLLMLQYTQCYLYHSLMVDETDNQIRDIFQMHLQQEISLLSIASQLLKQYQRKEYTELVGEGSLPSTLSFGRNLNIGYIRDVLKSKVAMTAMLEEYMKVDSLPENYQFFKYNAKVNGYGNNSASHKVIDKYIAEFGEDYRYQDENHPVKELRDRKSDNTTLGR